jgi:hypothetical protein
MSTAGHCILKNNLLDACVTLKCWLQAFVVITHVKCTATLILADFCCVQ